VRRIRVAPVVSLVGFVFMMFAIMHKPAGNDKRQPEEKND
jgi:hypothetical protein